MKLASRRLICLGLVLLAACGGDDAGQTKLPVAADDYDGLRGRYFRDGTFTARTQQELVTLWNSGGSLFSANAQAPTFDFTNSMIVGVSAGSGPGCDGRFARIDRVLEDGQGLYVEYRMQLDAQPPTPGISCHLTNNIPLTHFVRVRASTKPVTFIRGPA